MLFAPTWWPDPVTINNRGVRRRVVNRRVRLRWAAAELPAIVRNCSIYGAMLIVDAALVPGCAATIISGAEEFPVTVRWSREGQLGVEFDTAQLSMA
jgi:hypothetical protein